MTRGSERHPDHPDDRVSLAGPDPLDVLRALLKVDPDAPPAAPEDLAESARDELRAP